MEHNDKYAYIMQKRRQYGHNTYIKMVMRQSQTIESQIARTVFVK